MNFAKKILFVLILFASLGTYAQTMLHPKISGIGFHPFKTENRSLFDENAIDANTQWIVEPGLMLSIETYIRGTQLSWRFMPGFYNDATAQPALFFHLGLKLRLFRIYRSSLDIAIGPTYNFRETWTQWDGYVPEADYNLNGNWENMIYLLGELEYKFFLADHWDITTSVMYGHSWQTFTFTLGVRYWLTTKIKHPIGCGSCPFDDTKYKSKRR